MSKGIPRSRQTEILKDLEVEQLALLSELTEKATSLRSLGHVHTARWFEDRAGEVRQMIGLRDRRAIWSQYMLAAPIRIL